MLLAVFDVVLNLFLISEKCTKYVLCFDKTTQSILNRPSLSLETRVMLMSSFLRAFNLFSIECVGMLLWNLWPNYMSSIILSFSEPSSPINGRK